MTKKRSLILFMAGSSGDNKLGAKLRDILLGKRPDFSVGVLIYPGGKRYQEFKERIDKETRGMLVEKKSAQDISDYRRHHVGGMLGPITEVLDSLGRSYSEFPLGEYIVVERISRRDIYEHLLPHPDVGRLEYRKR
jgi:hypothetical protein